MNGSGQSSLFNALMGTVTAATGRIRLFGDPPAKPEPGLVSYTPQTENINLDFPLSVRDVVMPVATADSASPDVRAPSTSRPSTTPSSGSS